MFTSPTPKQIEDCAAGRWRPTSRPRATQILWVLRRPPESSARSRGSAMSHPRDPWRPDLTAARPGARWPPDGRRVFTSGLRPFPRTATRQGQPALRELIEHRARQTLARAAVAGAGRVSCRADGLGRAPRRVGHAQELRRARPRDRVARCIPVTSVLGPRGAHPPASRTWPRSGHVDRNARARSARLPSTAMTRSVLELHGLPDWFASTVRTCGSRRCPGADYYAREPE